MNNYEELYKTIDYRFSNEGLLKKALTHSSYAAEHKLGYEMNNERLEFIGDAYVDAVVGMKLFEMMDKAHEGVLSRRRAEVVCESTLAEVASDMKLGDFIILGKGEASNGGSEKPSILSDAFEALMGAVFIDGGYDAVKDVVLRLLDKKIRLAAEGKLNSDHKTRLQEYLQDKDHNVKIEYRVIDQSGPDHRKQFTVAAYANDVALGTGTGASKAKAEQAAAENALSKGVNKCTLKE